MKMIGDMGFEMYLGACNTFVSNNEEFVLLCFSYGYDKTCHRWDEHFVKQQGSTIFSDLTEPISLHQSRLPIRMNVSLAWEITAASLSQLVGKQQLIQKFSQFQLIHGLVGQDTLTRTG